MSKELHQEYSELSVAIDLVSHAYQTSNPIIIAEKMKEDLDMNYTIHQISDHLDINRNEDYFKESNKVEYQYNY